MIYLLATVVIVCFVFYRGMFVRYLSVFECIRNTLLALVMCVLFSMPIGTFDTYETTVVESEMSSSWYVAPCDHHSQEGEKMVCVTPSYTTLLELCFNEDETSVCYCPECYTRREALKLYYAER